METRLTLAWLQCLLQRYDLVGPLDDVDFFSAQFADDGLHRACPFMPTQAPTGPRLVAGLDGDFGALAGLAGDGADDHGGVVDFGND